jgi:hypothetical protein
MALRAWLVTDGSRPSHIRLPGRIRLSPKMPTPPLRMVLKFSAAEICGRR